MIRFVIGCLLFISCWPAGLFAQDEDGKLNDLIRTAASRQDLDSYSSVCVYLSEIERYPDLLLQYADSVRQVAIRDGKKQGEMDYFSFCAEAYFMQGNYQAGFQWKRKAFEMAEQEQCKSKMLAYVSDLGYYYNVATSYDSARYFLNKGLSIAASSTEFSSLYRLMLTNLASSFIYEGENDSALVYVHQAERCSAHDKDTVMWLENLNQLGTLYRRTKQMDLSIQHFELALKLCEQQKNHRLASFIYANIATVYCDWNRPEEAIPFSQKALENAKKFGTPQMIGLFYLNLGAVQCKIPALLSESVTSIKQSLGCLKQTGNKRRLCEAYNYLVIVNLQLNQLEEAERYLALLDELSGVLQTDVELYRYYQANAILLKSKKKFAAALKYYQKMTQLQKNGYHDSKDYECYISMADCHLNLRQYQEAFHHLDTAYALRDSVYQKEHIEELTRFSVRYKTQEKELEIAHLKEQDLERRSELLKNRILVASVLIVLVWLVFILIYMRQRQKVRLAKKYTEGLESERERIAKELHDDVCNSLLAISLNIEELVVSNPQKELKEQLLHLQHTRERLRTLSHVLMPPIFQFANLDEMLRDYSLYISESAHIKIDYESASQSDWNFLPQDIVLEFYRIAQEAINNALKYSDATCVEVKLEWKQQNLSVSIQDNGKGFDLANVKKGLGLQTITQRAEAVKAQATCTSELGKGTRWYVQVCVTNKLRNHETESSSIGR